MTAPARFRCRVVGVSFAEDYPDCLYRLRETEPGFREGSFIREPDNEHDPNAIALLCGGRKVGHLPRLVAKRYAPEIDAGARYVVSDYDVLIDQDHDDRPGLVIEAVKV
jgi:hypothetical protein